MHKRLCAVAIDYPPSAGTKVFTHDCELWRLPLSLHPSFTGVYLQMKAGETVDYTRASGTPQVVRRVLPIL